MVHKLGYGFLHLASTVADSGARHGGAGRSIQAWFHGDDPQGDWVGSLG